MYAALPFTEMDWPFASCRPCDPEKAAAALSVPELFITTLGAVLPAFVARMLMPCVAAMLGLVAAVVLSWIG